MIRDLNEMIVSAGLTRIYGTQTKLPDGRDSRRIPRAYARTGNRSKDCEALRFGQNKPVKYWEIIADRLHTQGWSYGIAEHFTQHGFLYCVDAHRDGKRFIVKADELMRAFLSLERDAIALKASDKSNQK